MRQCATDVIGQTEITDHKTATEEVQRDWPRAFALRRIQANFQRTARPFDMAIFDLGERVAWPARRWHVEGSTKLRRTDAGKVHGGQRFESLDKGLYLGMKGHKSDIRRDAEGCGALAAEEGNANKYMLETM
jgi:hypothetical protein